MAWWKWMHNPAHKKCVCVFLSIYCTVYGRKHRAHNQRTKSTMKANKQTTKRVCAHTKYEGIVNYVNCERTNKKSSKCVREWDVHICIANVTKCLNLLNLFIQFASICLLVCNSEHATVTVVIMCGWLPKPSIPLMWSNWKCNSLEESSNSCHFSIAFTCHETCCCYCWFRQQ